MDLLIISVPGENSYSIPAAPSLLISSVTKAGFSCSYIDFNIRFKNTYHKNFLELENYFITGIDSNINEEATKLVEYWVNEIIDCAPKYVGVSVFTYQNRKATEIFCKILKQKTKIKIILGGQGISDGGIQGKKKWVSELKEKNLIDFWITSEGEISLVELLKGNINHIGINSENFLQINNLDTLDYPNFDFYKLNEYDKKYLPVLSSRGCVKDCTFCDIHEHWQYRYRKGKNVAEELIFLSKKYDIHFFNFTDSLVNGNLKEFRNFLETMASYNQQNKPIEWKGQFIIRSKKTLNDEYWQLLKQGGAKMLTIGIESGSESVRRHMKKYFTNDDVTYTLEMLQKNDIKCGLLFIIGYVTETEKEYNETLKMLENYKNYIDNTIIDITLGQTLGILPNTYLHKNAEKLNLILDSKNENNWFLSTDYNFDIFERLKRLEKAFYFLKNLGYSVELNEELLEILELNYSKFKKINKVKQNILNKNKIDNNVSN